MNRANQAKKEPISRRALMSRWFYFTIHLIGICLLFFIPELAMSISTNDAHMPLEIYVKVFLTASIFYINYYVIIDRTLIPKLRFGRFCLYNILLIFAILFLIYLSWTFLGPGAHPHHVDIPAKAHFEPRPQSPWPLLTRDFLLLTLTISFSVALRLNSRWQRIERDRKEIESMRKEVELAQLRSQLNPHFLFNTLNGIYALIEINPEKAKIAIHRLSKLLRHMLYDSRGQILLKKECDFISDYIELMRMRMSANFPLKVEIDNNDDCQLMIQPLLFINIIENAFKYGLRSSGQQLIEISLKTEGTTVCCICRNSYDPTEHNSTTNHSDGIGLTNLRRRLELRYPDCHTLTIDDDGALFTVSMTIDIQQTTNNDKQ